MQQEENNQPPQGDQESTPASDHTPEVMPSPEEMLQTAERMAQEHYDAWMYAKAESENIRRRAHEDVDKARKYALEKFAAELVAVKDSLDAALAVETGTIESYRSGVELTQKQLASVFEKFHVTEVYPVGEKFDPHKHQAISMVEADAEANTVINVLQKGYLLHERVLRPALVMVAKPKA